MDLHQLSTGLKQFLGKLQSNFDFEKGWLPFLNLQVKWAIAFFARVAAVLISIALVLVILKKLEVAGTIRSLVMHDIMGIVPKSTKVISAPKISYTEDLRSLDEIIKMLEKKNEIKNEINAESTATPN